MQPTSYVTHAAGAPVCPGCVAHRMMLFAVIDYTHQHMHKRLDATWGRPVELPPSIPWHECGQEPCVSVTEQLAVADTMHASLEGVYDEAPPRTTS